MSEEVVCEEGEDCPLPKKCEGEYCKEGLELFGRYVADMFTVLTFFIVWMMQFWFAIGSLAVELVKFLSCSSGAVRRIFVGSGLIMLCALVYHSLGGRTASAIAKNQNQQNYNKVNENGAVSYSTNSYKQDKLRSTKAMKSVKCCKEPEPTTCNSRLSTLLDLFFTGQVFWA